MAASIPRAFAITNPEVDQRLGPIYERGLLPDVLIQKSFEEQYRPEGQKRRQSQ